MKQDISENETLFSKINKGTFGDVCALNTHPLHFRFNWGVFAKWTWSIKAMLHIHYYTQYKINKKQKPLLPEMKEIQSLCTADAAWLHSLFSWALQDAASDIPSLKVNKNKEDCGIQDFLQCSTLCPAPGTLDQLRHNSWFCVGLWGHGVHQWNRTVGIWVTWPAQVSSHEAWVTHVELARCDFQASSGVWTDWSVFRCRFRLRSKCNAGVLRCLSCSFTQVLSFREHL